VARPANYRFAGSRRLDRALSELGADIRNDLNNPLQEIVAMAFVAQAAGELSPVAEQALDAIENAAMNLSQVVNALEGKIRGVMS
jgi:signal transduction histidine kinase